MPLRHSVAAVGLALLVAISITASTATATATATATTAALAPPAGYKAGELIWQDRFSHGLDGSKWNPYMTSRTSNGWPWFAGRNGVPSTCSALSNPGYLYADYLCPSQVAVTHGNLRLTEKPAASVRGYSYVGGVVTTYQHFQLAGGYVQIRAKMPDVSKGGWPAIWFLPGPGATLGRRSEIDLYEGGFTAQNAHLPARTPINDIFISHYHGPHSGWVQAARRVSDLSRSYHVYGMEYIPGVSIKTFIDGHLVGKWTKDIDTVPYQVIINTGVATSATAGWHVTGSSRATASMLVSDVQVYQHPRRR